MLCYGVFQRLLWNSNSYAFSCAVHFISIPFRAQLLLLLAFLEFCFSFGLFKKKVMNPPTGGVQLCRIMHSFFHCVRMQRRVAQRNSSGSDRRIAFMPLIPPLRVGMKIITYLVRCVFPVHCSFAIYSTVIVGNFKSTVSHQNCQPSWRAVKVLILTVSSSLLCH